MESHDRETGARITNTAGRMHNVIETVGKDKSKIETDRDDIFLSITKCCEIRFMKLNKYCQFIF